MYTTFFLISGIGFLGPAEHIGSGYVMPEHFKSTEGRKKIPIISKKCQPIGQFVFDYLVIKPIHEKTDENVESNKVTSKKLFICDGDTNEKELDVSSKFTETAKTIPNNNLFSNLCNFKVSYAKHWKSDWSGLEVAHRGLGNSYTKSQRYIFPKIVTPNQVSILLDLV